MLESAWLFVGAVGVLSTAAAVVSSDDGVAIVGGVLGFVSWGIWTLGAFDVRVVGDSVTYTFSMPTVALLGIALALIPGYVALTGPVEIIGRARRGQTRPDEF